MEYADRFSAMFLAMAKISRKLLSFSVSLEHLLYCLHNYGFTMLCLVISLTKGTCKNYYGKQEFFCIDLWHADKQIEVGWGGRRGKGGSGRTPMECSTCRIRKA
jgi:hypothetical protein